MFGYALVPAVATNDPPSNKGNHMTDHPTFGEMTKNQQNELIVTLANEEA